MDADEDAGKDADGVTNGDADPELCPVCLTPYDSVSLHDRGLLVNLLDNERYRRVCFEPVERDGRPHVRFFHHTHEQVGEDD
ncbi:hypothetical protein ACOZ4B_16220 [Haloferax prahovense]|uniref:hypothetical protein n=1 Tax=Haloferax prahovense TaxID=381852 RepID=UPI003C7827AA